MRLIESSNTKSLYNSLTEDFRNPCRYAKMIMNFDIDANKWNGASQEERDAMVRPKIEEFWKQYGDDILKHNRLKRICYDLEDSNFHTELRILLDVAKNSNMNESLIPNMNDENFADTVKRDFRLFLMNKYGDELYRDVTNDDINEYFTDMFYDVWDENDLDSSNEAEKIIRNEYNCLDSRSFDDYEEYDDGDTNLAAEEASEADERFENRYMCGGNGAVFHESAKLNEADIIGFNGMFSVNCMNLARSCRELSKLRYYAKNYDKKVGMYVDTIYNSLFSESYCGILTKYGMLTCLNRSQAEKYLNKYKVFDALDMLIDSPSYELSSRKNISAEQIKELLIAELDRFGQSKQVIKDDTSLKEAEKVEKEDKRVIMQQGNVTCIKENSSYLVFENENDNEVEHDSEESAMQDFLERVGIDANNELTESKKLNESGEWDDYDEANIESKNYLTDVAKYIASKVPNGYYRKAVGFDAYQGPYALVGSDIAGGELWYWETDELFQLETEYGWIVGNKGEIVEALSNKDYLLKLVEETKKLSEQD